jgi:hypothetical protein
MRVGETMTQPFTVESLREIVETQIARDERLGTQTGSSGHMGDVGYTLDAIEEPVRNEEGWAVTYRYTTTVTTEFTIYPDNPPYEYSHEKTIILDDDGNVVSEGAKRLLSTNWEPEPQPNPAAPEEMVQRVIDLKTGRDITAEHVSQRLKELEVDADRIIQRARNEAEAAPERRREVYEAAHREIYERLGVGSIGPATAAAGPLMREKMWELAEVMGIDESERLL